jgi:hypothetical protein
MALFFSELRTTNEGQILHDTDIKLYPVHVCALMSLFPIKTDECTHTKVKGKCQPRTGYEVPEGEKMYSSTLPSTSALDGGG